MEVAAWRKRFHAVSKATLEALASAAKSGSLRRSTLGMSVREIVKDGGAERVALELDRLFGEGLSEQQIGELLQKLANRKVVRAVEAAAGRVSRRAASPPASPSRHRARPDR